MLQRAFQYFLMFIVFSVQISTFNCIPDKFPSNIGLNVSFNSFPNANIMSQPATTGTSGAFGQPTFSFPYGKNFSQPIATTSISAVSPFQRSQPSTTPSLETFISTFTDAVHASPILADLFEVSGTPLQDLENFLYHESHALFEIMDATDPHEGPSYFSYPVTESLEILTYPMLVNIDSNAMGKFLLAEGILNDTNAVSLALAFANEMEISAVKTVQKHSPMSKFRALMDGYIGFIKSQGLYEIEKMLATAKYYGEEIRLAGKRFDISARNYESANV